MVAAREHFAAAREQLENVRHQVYVCAIDWVNRTLLKVYDEDRGRSKHLKNLIDRLELVTAWSHKHRDIICVQ
jgi:hypothetical protein